MHIPRIWKKESVEAVHAQGDAVHATAWGWSDSSEGEARERAQTSAKRVLQWLLRDCADDAPSHYGYDERLPREEIIKEYLDEVGHPSAFVSRNQYGSLILNTRDLMFIDVDIPPAPKVGPLAFMKTLFGGKKTPEPADLAADLLQKIREAAVEQADTGFRIYRTHSGFRLMVTDEQLLADSPRAQHLLQAFQADPLYVRMCKNQQCFRARLTPKPWRCEISMPPTKYPFVDTASEAAFRSWEKQYSEGVRGFRTCQLIDTVGPPSVHPALTELVELHDRLCQVESSAPLA